MMRLIFQLFARYHIDALGNIEQRRISLGGRYRVRGYITLALTCDDNGSAVVVGCDFLGLNGCIGSSSENHCHRI